MAELQRALFIVKTEERYEPSFSYRWDLLERWLPGPVAEGRRLSRERALDRLIGRYLRGAVFSSPALLVPALLGAPGGGRFGRRAAGAEGCRVLARGDRRAAGPLGGERRMTEAPAGSRHIAIEAFSPDVRGVLRAVDALLGPGRDGWVVGGAVRDALLGRAAGDLDLAVPTGALRLGRALADGLGWSFVTLDAERGVCRIVGDLQIDIADFRGPDLGADLAGRDFTVNALAASVAELVDEGMADVEDATGGLADLEARRVRLCGPRSLAEDPVRTLRVAVLAVQPGWSVDPGVESAARAAAPSLRESSAERVRDELVALVNGPGGRTRAPPPRSPRGGGRRPPRERRDASDASTRAASLRRVGALAAGRGGDG